MECNPLVVKQSACFDYNLGRGVKKCALDIYHLKGGRGHQIFAIFDFINETGVMRFINPQVSQNATNRGATKVRNEKHQKENTEEDENEAEDGDEDEASCDEFHMDKKNSPSRRNPT